MEFGANRFAEAGRNRLGARLRSHTRQHGAAAGSELSRTGRAFHGASRRAGDRFARAVEAHVPATPDVHDRSRIADPRRVTDLSVAWRHRIRRRDRGAALSQAAGAAHLVRLRRDGARWRAITVRPALASWCAEARAAEAVAPGGGVAPCAARFHGSFLRYR